MPPSMQQEIVELLKNDPAISCKDPAAPLSSADSRSRAAIRDVKGIVMGKDNFRFKAELNWNGGEITRQYLATLDLEKELKEIKDPEKFREFLIRFGEAVIDKNGEVRLRVARRVALCAFC